MYSNASFHPYIALIGDIRKSKKIKDRNQVQIKLNATLDYINEKYVTNIASKFMITLGDEFQGLLLFAENTFNIVEEIQQRMYPVEIRFGIGIGEIATDINPQMSIGADGPGYYKARNAIENLKKQEMEYKKEPANIRIEIEKNESAERMLNTIFTLLSVIQNNWTDRQREIIWDYERYKGSQEQCAKRLGITQSSIQRGLANGNYYAYKEAVENVKEILKELGAENV